jgi:hypothetical protein
MAGKTVSAYVEESIAARLARIAEVEDRKVSHLAASALGFYTLLPAEAHAALRRIEAFGESDDLLRAARRVARVLLEVQYEVAERGIVESMETSALGELDSEEAILEAATRLTRGKEPAAERRAAREGLRQRAGLAPGGKEKRPGSTRGTRSAG